MPQRPTEAPTSQVRTMHARMLTFHYLNIMASGMYELRVTSIQGNTETRADCDLDQLLVTHNPRVAEEHVFEPIRE
jgi:hypothetical protein